MAKNEAGIGKLIVFGGSAGSIDALIQIIPGLRPGFPYPVVLVLHRKSMGDNLLSGLLAARTTLPIKEIEDKDMLAPGSVYIAPGDYHVLFERDGSLALDHSEKVAFSRPSIDVSFLSASHVYGPALTGILLSGANGDGAEGLKQIRDAGGVTIAQSPASALIARMPQQAIDIEAAEHVLDVAGIAAFLNGA